MLGPMLATLLLLLLHVHAVFVDAFTSQISTSLGVSSSHAHGRVPLQAHSSSLPEDDAASLHSKTNSDSDSSPPFARGISSAELRQAADAASVPRTARSSRFLQGDALHRLRQHVWSLRQDLMDLRGRANKNDGVTATDDDSALANLEQAIIFAQNLDAEFVYATCREREQYALRVGDTDVAREFRTQAQHARNSLPQFQLEGLWVGKSSSPSDGESNSAFEMINVTYHGDTLVAYKVTGGDGVGRVCFQVDLSLDDSGPPQEHQHRDVLEPIQLEDPAAKQWGSQFLQRFAGKGRVTRTNDDDAYHWVDGQLILVNQYFSFAFQKQPSEQVFFGRPSAELTLKLLRQDRRKKDHSFRAYLERCFQHDSDSNHISDRHQKQQHEYYSQEGCFE